MFWPVLQIHIGFNANPKPAFYLNADPNPAFHLIADPDSGSQTNADQDPDPGQTLPSQNVEFIH
jgi:hypothetical protein